MTEELKARLVKFDPAEIEINVGSLAQNLYVGDIISIKGRSVPKDAQGLRWLVISVSEEKIEIRPVKKKRGHAGRTESTYGKD